MYRYALTMDHGRMCQAAHARVIGSLSTIFNLVPIMNGGYAANAMVDIATGLIQVISIQTVMIIVLLLPGYSAII